jgi:hypothetical protein
MGQSKNGGYQQLQAVTPEQQSLLSQLIGQAGGNLGQAAQGYAQFLPGGGAGEAFAKQAQQRFQQQTMPTIMNAFGSGAKGSSALNQALAQGGANLNTDIASMLANAQLQAAGGMGQLGMGQSQLGAGTNQFAWTPQQQPFWQQLLLSAVGTAGDVGRGMISSGSGQWAKSQAAKQSIPSGYGYSPKYGMFNPDLL